MGNGGAIAAILCVLGFGLAIGTLIGGVLLRAACSLFNKLVGGRKSPNSVPEPLLGKAMGITFVTSLVNIVVGFALNYVGVGAAAGANPGNAALLAQSLSLPVSFLVMAAMNAALLPTTFVRGLLVAACYLLVALFVLLVLGAIFGGLFLVYSLLR